MKSDLIEELELESTRDRKKSGGSRVHIGIPVSSLLGLDWWDPWARDHCLSNKV